jgi:hypothetical protein
MYGKQNKTGGIRQDIVLVNEEERPCTPDRDILRKTGIPGTGIRSSRRRRPGKPDRDHDGN